MWSIGDLKNRFYNPFQEVDMPYILDHFLYLFLLYAAIKDLQERKIPKAYFILFPLFFFFLLAYPFDFSHLKHSLTTLFLWILSLLLSYPLFYFTAAGGADWKLCSLLLPLIPLGESLPLLLLASFFSIIMYFFCRIEEIPFAFSLFLGFTAMMLYKSLPAL